jgi:hypothetical protein
LGYGRPEGFRNSIGKLWRFRAGVLVIGERYIGSHLDITLHVLSWRLVSLDVKYGLRY